MMAMLLVCHNKKGIHDLKYFISILTTFIEPACASSLCHLLPPEQADEL